MKMFRTVVNVTSFDACSMTISSARTVVSSNRIEARPLSRRVAPVRLMLSADNLTGC